MSYMLSKLYFDVNRPYGLPEICFKISDFALSGRLIFFYRAIIFSRIWNGKYWNFSNSWQIQIKRLQISQLVFSKPLYIGLTSEPWIYEKAIAFWQENSNLSPDMVKILKNCKNYHIFVIYKKIIIIGLGIC